MIQFEGRLEAIHIAPARGEDLEAHDAAEVEVGVGLVGDRYGRSETAAKKSGGYRAVTLIEAEALEALERDYGHAISGADSRRNLLTRGVPLNHLVGVEFTIGEARLRGTELCEPCGYLEKKTAAGVREGLVHRGGLRAEVLAGGRIAVGETIRPTGDATA